MNDGGAARPARTVGVVVAVLALIAAGYAVVTLLTAPVVFDEGDREISVTSGTPFSIRLKDNPSTGFRWVLAAPKPDPAILQETGGHYVPDEPVRAGSGGIRYVDFRARGAGRTEVTLKYCFRCGTPQADEQDENTRTRRFQVSVD
ncbi:protease inhibitor I42 family protein [Streptomyces sp. NPDC007100]|uniref:protease inhibitor I42 family protein n=1 Tax=unclassified Streptomyces TaxID=2593676 RepID=UPI0033D7C1BD